MKLTHWKIKHFVIDSFAMSWNPEVNVYEIREEFR